MLKCVYVDVCACHLLCDLAEGLDKVKGVPRKVAKRHAWGYGEGRPGVGTHGNGIENTGWRVEIAFWGGPSTSSIVKLSLSSSGSSTRHRYLSVVKRPCYKEVRKQLCRNNAFQKE